MSKLIIVESPSKAKTISKILGSSYKVVASNGHLVDLPKGKLGIDEELNAEYVVDKSKSKKVKELKESRDKATTIFLASDPDREGEAISYHIANLLGLDMGDIRIEFNEITETAIKEAIKNPRAINMNKVNAQQTRRILDRLVGFGISPLLWKNLGYSTSAGRVQSVALKVICELEDSIKKFVPEKYFKVEGIFLKESFALYKISDKKVDKVKDRALLTDLENLKGREFKLDSKVSKKISKAPLPYKTSSLQQAASSELGYSPSRTMKIAQAIYVGVEISGKLKGLITYIRTDSNRVSEEAINSAKKYIEKSFGKEYLANSKAVAKKGKIQDAHEAIRPTDVSLTPESIKGKVRDDQYKLYKLIYDRFLASQMAAIEYDQMEAVYSKDAYSFRRLFNKVTFKGYSLVYKADNEYLDELPKLTNTALDDIKIEASETKPPARLSEASLVKQLEKEGIGRPSTYSSIVETLKDREYVELKEKRFHPTNLGYSVKDILNENFPTIMNIKFTSQMEDSLDEVEQGKKVWKDLLKDFNSDLEKHIEKYKSKKEEKKDIETDVKCSECQNMMLLKKGRFGFFVECEMKHKRSVPKELVEYEEEKSGFVSLEKELNRVTKSRAGQKTDVLIEGLEAILKEGPYGAYLEVEKDGKKIRESIPKSIKIDMNADIVKLKDELARVKKVKDDLEAAAAPCEKCQGKMTVKQGKWGPFLSCSNFPKCKNIRKIAKD